MFSAVGGMAETVGGGIFSGVRTLSLAWSAQSLTRSWTLAPSSLESLSLMTRW